MEYETLEEGVLSAGELTVDIPAQAVLGGSGGNAAAGYISTLVTPVTGIDLRDQRGRLYRRPRPGGG